MKIKIRYASLVFILVFCLLHIPDALSCLYPVARISPATQAVAKMGTGTPDVAYFDGSYSYDDDGEIVEYSWGFGDGAYGETGQGTAYASCKYTTTGIKTVTLVVKDDDGLYSLPDSCEVKVLQIEIIEPNNNPVTDNNFAFNSASPDGVCNVTNITGTSGVVSENPNLEWTLTLISGSNQSSNPSPPKGASPTFTYTTLPSSNSGFGNKTLTLTHPEITSSDTEIVQIFFSRDATNHAGTGSGTTRNWYYYWKEGGVVSDLSQFGYVDTGLYGQYYPTTGNLEVGNYAPTQNYAYNVTKKHTYITSGSNGIANTTAQGDDVQVIPVNQGKPNTTIITSGANSTLDTTPSGDDQTSGNTITSGANGIANTTAQSDDVQVIPVNQGEPNSTIITEGSNGILNTTPSGDDTGAGGGQQFTIGATGTGINCCAETCAHELKHKWIHDNWTGTDTDGDKVPDSEEEKSPYYFNKYDPDSYNLAGTIYPTYATFGDSEFLARMAEQSPGSVDASIDWSDTNGKNWNQ